MLDEKRITPSQCRAARALLGWTREDLASVSNVSKMTLADFETGKREPYDRTLTDIESALYAGGVSLTRAVDTAGSGVRFLNPFDRTQTVQNAKIALLALRTMPSKAE